MKVDEIKGYCSTGYGVCVYRKRVKKAQFIVQSIYISGGREGKYSVDIEFDPMGMVNQGEGIRWGSNGDSLEDIIVAIEKYSGRNISEWENYTKTGFEPHYSSERLTNEDYEKSWSTFEFKHENGLNLLPDALNFECKSIISLN